MDSEVRMKRVNELTYDVFTTYEEYTPADLRKLADEVAAKWGADATLKFEGDSLDVRVVGFRAETDGERMERLREEEAAEWKRKRLEDNREVIQQLVEEFVLVASPEMIRRMIDRAREGEYGV